MYYHFRMRGIINYDIQKPQEVLYKGGKLTGDMILVQTLKSPTNDITDASEVIQTMSKICINGQIWGNYPEDLFKTNGI